MRGLVITSTLEFLTWTGQCNVSVSTSAHLRGGLYDDREGSQHTNHLHSWNEGRFALYDQSSQTSLTASCSFRVPGIIFIPTDECSHALWVTHGAQDASILGSIHSCRTSCWTDGIADMRKRSLAVDEFTRAEEV